MEKASSSGKRTIYLVYTLGVPGLGKSSLVNKMKDAVKEIEDSAIEVCVSDEIRSGYLAKEYGRRALDLDNTSQEDIFRIELECGPKIKEELTNQIKLKLAKLSLGETKTNIFVLDKNHCTQDLISFIWNEAELAFACAQVEGRVLVADLFDKDETPQFYPFSFDTLTIGLTRSLNREGHPTMKYGKVHSLLSFITCLQNHLNDNFDLKFPQDNYKRIKVGYYNRQTVANFKKNGHNDIAYKRLEHLVSSLAHKTVSVSEGAPSVITALGQLKEMNEYINFDNDYMRDIILQYLI